MNAKVRMLIFYSGSEAPRIPPPPASKSLPLLPGLLPIPAKLTKNPFIAGAISRQKLISASALLEFSF